MSEVCFRFAADQNPLHAVGHPEVLRHGAPSCVAESHVTPPTLWRWGSSCVKVFMSVLVWLFLLSWMLELSRSRVGSSAVCSLIRKLIKSPRRSSFHAQSCAQKAQETLMKRRFPLHSFLLKHHINKLQSSPAAELFNSEALRGHRLCLGSEASSRDRVRAETQASWNVWTVSLSWSAAQSNHRWGGEVKLKTKMSAGHQTTSFKRARNKSSPHQRYSDPEKNVSTSF